MGRIWSLRRVEPLQQRRVFLRRQQPRRARKVASFDYNCRPKLAVFSGSTKSFNITQAAG